MPKKELDITSNSTYRTENKRFRVKINTVSGKINVNLAPLNIASFNDVSAVDIITKRKADDTTGIFAVTLDKDFTKTGGDIHVYDVVAGVSAPDGTIVVVTVIYK